MTFNVQGLRRDPEPALRIIEASEADIVCLQEVAGGWHKAIEDLSLDYPYTSHAEDSPGYGIAVLSRWPLAGVRVIHPPWSWHAACRFVADTRIGRIQFAALHLTPPLRRDLTFTIAALLDTGPVHLKEIQSLYNALDSTLPTVILGDFNEDRFGAATTWLTRRGLLNALSQYDITSPTWVWSDFRLVSARLDHVFHSEDLECLAAQVSAQRVSDHRPVVAALGPNGRNLPNRRNANLRHMSAPSLRRQVDNGCVPRRLPAGTSLSTMGSPR